MIFYFSGTGNSYAAAKQLLTEGETLINISDCVHERKFSFALKGEKTAGFVFPVYFGGLPSIVSYFLEKINFSDEDPSYLYALLTCGGMACGADYMLEQKLSVNGYSLNAIFTVKMPDNYILLSDVAPEKEIEENLSMAHSEINVIKDQILAGVKIKERSNMAGKTASALMYPMYRNGRKTSKFWVDDQCVGCGLCAKRCPSKAIAMEDHRPVWEKEQCIFCLGCINRCGAIQYGKKTVKRGRYKNPVFQKSHGNE